MQITAFVHILSFFAGVSVALLAILFRRFGPASWILSLYLLPAACACGVLAAATAGVWNSEESLRLVFRLLIICVPGGLLSSYTINREDYLDSLKPKRITFIVVLLAGIWLAVTQDFTADTFVEISGLPYGSIALGWAGFFSAFYLLLVSVIVLANLEQTLRSAEEYVRWEIKFLLIGLAASFAAVIYVASRLLLYPPRFSFLTPDMMGLFSIIFLLSCILILISWRRSSGQARVVVSHGFIYSSITLLGVGIYLISSSLVARWASKWGDFGLPVEALIFLVAVLVLTVLLLTTTFRHRALRWIRLNLFGGGYDYRRYWLEAMERMQSIDSMEKTATSLIDMVQRSLGAINVSIWLRMRDPNRLQLLAAQGEISGTLSRKEFRVGEEFFKNYEPIEVKVGKSDESIKIDPDLISQTRASLFIPLVSSGRFVGLLAIGSDRSGKPFDWQSRELLGVLAGHAAGELHKSEMLSSLIKTKEMEAFHSFSTFLLHDLKNFASTLSLISQNATRYQDNPEFNRDAFRSVFETAEKMKRLCNSLRTFSSPPAPDMKYEDLNGIIRSAVGKLDTGPSEHFRMNLETLPRVQVDGREMERVIQNLLLNALEAIPPQGNIVVTTKRRDTFVEIIVSDDGEGMPKDFLEKELFLPFRTTKSDGLGIGLYQTKRIIEAHSGSIRVESAVGRGTTITIAIPVA